LKGLYALHLLVYLLNKKELLKELLRELPPAQRPAQRPLLRPSVACVSLLLNTRSRFPAPLPSRTSIEPGTESQTLACLLPIA